MSETHNFVILGGSAAGLGIAHSFLKHIEPKLKELGKIYHVYIAKSSSHFFWSSGSPRSLVSDTRLPVDKLFAPIADGFKSYDSSLYTIIHGTAESWDVGGRTVTIKLADSEKTETLPYFALVLATGVRTPSPATSLHGDYTVSKAAIHSRPEREALFSDICYSFRRWSDRRGNCRRNRSLPERCCVVV